MPTIYNPRPLTTPQRHAIAVKVVEKLGLIPIEVKDNGDHYGAGAIKVHVVTSAGKTFNVCPWCKNAHEGEYDDGTELRLFRHTLTCSRPNHQYSAAECGQPDYQRDWS